MDYLKLPGAAIGTIAFGAKTILTPPLKDYYLFIFCLNGQAELKSGRTELTIGKSQGIVVNESHILQGRFSQDCEQFIFRLDHDYVTSYLGRPGAKFCSRMDLNNPRLSPWLSLLRLVTKDPTMLGIVQSNKETARDFTRVLTHSLIEGLGVIDNEAEYDRPCPKSVHRAIAFMEAHAIEPLTLDDIAEAAGVPPRTLQEAFRRFRDMSPMRYLRNLRLDMARDRLVSGGPEVKVASVALECGIGHFGRFSHEYAMRFGESPSATIRKGVLH